MANYVDHLEGELEFDELISDKLNILASRISLATSVVELIALMVSRMSEVRGELAAQKVRPTP